MKLKNLFLLRHCEANHFEENKSDFEKQLNENGETEVAEITPDQEVQMVNNYLEKSNVNPVEELILTLEHQRNYETHVKFIDLAKQMDEGGASLMRVPD